MMDSLYGWITPVLADPWLSGMFVLANTILAVFAWRYLIPWIRRLRQDSTRSLVLFFVEMDNASLGRCLHHALDEGKSRPSSRTDELITLMDTAIEIKQKAVFEDEKQTLQGEHLHQGLNGKRVLLVEDNTINRDILLHHLKTLGCRNEDVVLADNGEEAVNIYQHHDFDFVLMDIRMPVLDGISATQRIRAFEEDHYLPATPVIAVTGSSHEEDRRRYIAAGMNAHISKPFTFRSLARVLQNT